MANAGGHRRRKRKKMADAGGHQGIHLTEIGENEDIRQDNWRRSTGKADRRTSGSEEIERTTIGVKQDSSHAKSKFFRFRFKKPWTFFDLEKEFFNQKKKFSTQEVTNRGQNAQHAGASPGRSQQNHCHRCLWTFGWTSHITSHA